jgi:GNAT superfamily N-acetyltransferase
VEIRRARLDEYEAIGALTEQSYVDGGFVGAASPYRAELRDAAGRAEHAELLVAADGDTLLGAVAFVPPGSPLGEVTDAADAGFRMLAVTEEARRRGVGQALVNACLARARELGCVHMRLSTQDDMVDAHRLYERLGFVRTPERDWTPMPGVLLITYALRLGEEE